MPVINSVDSLMAIFGYKRVTCEACHHSEGTHDLVLMCNHRNVLVERDSQCADFVRATGVDDE